MTIIYKDEDNKKSKYVGVSWGKRHKKWQATIRIDGKNKNLGYYRKEKEAACKYDEQAALFNKPVNFPQHEGQEQVAKASARRDLSKLPDVNRPSKYVGVSWSKRHKKWRAQIMTDGKKKTLGHYHDEEYAAHIYDEQAALLCKAVNFPLHENMEQAVKRAPERDLSKLPNVYRASKYIGVNWNKGRKKWEAKITINGKRKSLGYYQDENEAARTYDEQAALLNRSVNFPQHEGQEQAVKRRIGVMRRSKFVGVSWNNQMKKWKAAIQIDGKSKTLGYYQDENDAAHIYDDQAKLIDKPLNFPKEGQNKAKKHKCFDSIDNVQLKRTKIRYYL